MNEKNDLEKIELEKKKIKLEKEKLGLEKEKEKTERKKKKLEAKAKKREEKRKKKEGKIKLGTGKRILTGISDTIMGTLVFLLIVLLVYGVMFLFVWIFANLGIDMKWIISYSVLILGINIKLWIIFPLIIAFGIIYFGLAPKNIFFTFMKEGTARIVVTGDGAVSKVLIQWKDHVLDSEGNVVFKKQIFNIIRYLFGGLRYVGLWPLKKIYYYYFSWTAVTQSEEGKKGEKHHEKEKLFHILLKNDMYHLKVSGLETLDRTTGAAAEFYFTFRVVNPYKALFVIQDWLSTVLSLCTGAINRVFPTKTLADWANNQNQIPPAVMEKLEEKRGPNKETQSLRDEFYKDYGIEIKEEVALKNLELPEQYKKLISAPVEADLKRQETVITADATRQKTSLEGKGKADAVKFMIDVLKDAGDLGKFKMLCDAMADGKMTVPIMLSLVPGLQKFVDKQVGEGASEEEKKSLLEKVNKAITEENKEKEPQKKEIADDDKEIVDDDEG